MGAFAICKFGRCGASYDASDPRARDGLCPYCTRAQDEEETGSTGGISQPTMPTGKPRDPRKWGWCVEGDENAHGPFGSQAEAIDDAIENFLDDFGPGVYEVQVGRCEYFDPAETAKRITDADDFIVRMEENIFDNGFEVDDEIFTLAKDGKEAFEKAIADWASQYVHSNYWMLADDKKIEICAKEDDDC